MKRIVALGFLVVLGARFNGFDRKDVLLNNNRFQPAMITARDGDTLAFINGRGGPHNVQFSDDSLPDAAHRLIDAAMPTTESPVARRAAGRPDAHPRRRHFQSWSRHFPPSLSLLLRAAHERRNARNWS
jgi:hypothetical protein